MKCSKYVFLMAMLVSISLRANVKFPAFFGDNMVMQQQSNAAIWGTSQPNKMLRIHTGWDDKEYRIMADENGHWKTELKTPAAGGPYTIRFNDGKDTVLQNVMIGEVWFCSGQSNMEMPMKGYTNQAIENATRDILLSEDSEYRLFTVGRNACKEKQYDVKNGTWKEAQPESVRDFCATAYYFGRFLRETLKVPVGLIVSSWGGTYVESWMNEPSLSNFPAIEIPKGDVKYGGRTATALYNGMVYPFLGMSMKGCIWYQGESNYERPESYTGMFVSMVEGWRKDWNIGEFPFYYCQIAPYDYSIITKKGEPVINSAYLREAQMKAEYLIPNAGMAVLMDAGLEGGIHPRKKQVAGERLAMLALAGTYGRNVQVQSPRFLSMEIKDSMAVLTFDRAPMHLDWTRGYSKNFTIAGADSVFYPAQTHIIRAQVKVWSEKVPHPVAVRYGFTNWVDGDLFGANDMPVSSFRTDDWPVEPERIK